MHPEKREPHFLLQIRFDRRPDGNPSFPGSAKRLVNVRNVWKVEQFEEAIDGAPVLRFVIFRGNDAPATAGIADHGRRDTGYGTGVIDSGYSSSVFDVGCLIQSRGDPFHLRP